jgi:hypothetical protein
MGRFLRDLVWPWTRRRFPISPRCRKGDANCGRWDWTTTPTPVTGLASACCKHVGQRSARFDTASAIISEGSGCIGKAEASDSEEGRSEERRCEEGCGEESSSEEGRCQESRCQESRCQESSSEEGAFQEDQERLDDEEGEVTHPYLSLIDKEAERAETDLSDFRSRAVTVLTTSSGIVTLMTGLVTFAATRSNSASGSVPRDVIATIGLSILLFIVASGFALMANSPGPVLSPSKGNLLELCEAERWGDPSTAAAQECEVAEVTVDYLVTVRALAERTSERLQRAIAFQIGGVTIAGLAAVLMLSHFD